MMRRLILLIISVFVPFLIWRAVLLFVGCLIALQSNIIFRPFANRMYGRVESAFLFNLTIIAALQIPHAVYLYLGESEKYNVTNLAIDIIELILILLPLTICLLFFIGTHIYSLIMWIWRRWKQHRKSHSPCVTSEKMVEMQSMNSALKKPLMDTDQSNSNGQTQDV